MTGKPGVCMSTLGPGATNLVTGIAHAQLGGMPVVVITGQKGIRQNRQANFQVLDVVHMMKPLTKRTVQIQGPRSIPKEIRESFKTAKVERRGPCHMELPEDIAAEDLKEDLEPQPASDLRNPVGEIKALKKAVEMIKNAENPVVIVSSRAQRRRVRKALRKFCDITNIYVIHTQLGTGVLGADHKNSLFAFGIHGHDYVNRVIDRSDLVITVGYSTVEYPPSVWNEDRDKKILHIDFTPAYHDIYYAPTYELIGDIGSSLELINSRLEGEGIRFEGEFEKKLRKELEEILFEGKSEDGSFPLKSRRVVEDCRSVLDREDILCLDNGLYKLWFSRHYKTYDYGTFMVDNALASMGGGLPYAMTAKLLFPERKVLAVCGDGGFMMNSQELETAKRMGVDITVLILNDDSYGFIEWKQKNCNYRDFAMKHENPDFVKYAESYGLEGVKVEKAGELLPVLEESFEREGITLIECPIEYSEDIGKWGNGLSNL